MDEFTEVMPDVEIPVEVIVVPQIIEDGRFIYEQTNEVGCISRIKTGVIIPEILDELGEVVLDRYIESIIPPEVVIETNIETRLATVESDISDIVVILSEVIL